MHRYVRFLEGDPREAFVRIEVAPGEEAQVDFGYAGRMFDRKTGKWRKAWAFVMTLSHSRHQYAVFVFDQSVATWIRCHREAFEHFGGVPRRVVLENVPRNIFELLLPVALCGRRRPMPGDTRVVGRHRPHNDQSDDSQLSSASSVLQTGRWRDPPEAPGGSVWRNASIFAFVLISA